MKNLLMKYIIESMKEEFEINVKDQIEYLRIMHYDFMINLFNELNKYDY
jgi:hypothetical protein